MQFKLNPAARALIEADLLRVLIAGTDAYAEKLVEVLSGPGSGTQWRGNKNASSTAGEYPAEQSGDLLGSIGTEVTGPTEVAVGAFNAPAEAFELEFRDPAAGGRPWLSKSAEDPAFHQALEAAIQRAALE